MNSPYSLHSSAIPTVEAQQAYIQHLEARLEALSNVGQQSIVILDTRHQILDFNRMAAATARQRFHREMQQGECFTHYVQPDRLADFYESFGAALQGQHVFKERLIYAADNQGITYEMSYTPIYDAQGQIQSVCFAGINVEERHQIQLRLNQEQSFVSSILNNTHALMLVIDAKGRIVRSNKACDMLGYSAEFLQGKVLWEVLVAPAEREQVHQLYLKLARQDSSLALNAEYTLMDASGRPHRVSWSLSRMQGLKEAYDYFVSTGIDMSERLAAERALKESEAMLRQAQKMEAVGHLAGGIAHDFNNLLTTLMGYNELLNRMLPQGSEAMTYLDNMQQTCYKAKELTQQLLLFSRNSSEEVQVLNLAKHLEHMLGLLRPLLGNKIKLQLDFCEDPCLIQAPASQLEQVIMNLAVNARDAMSGAGDLAISLQQAYFTQSLQNRYFGEFKPGRYICLTVRDSGCGMDEEVRERIFEPFFTTKDLGKGTGLGLAIVYRIVQEAGGWVDVESQPGLGSAFHLYFPAFESPAAAKDTLCLFGLDDPGMIQTLQTQVQTCGYMFRVCDATDLQHEANAYKLVLTGLTESNLQLVQPLLNQDPGLRILYISGDSDQEMQLLDQIGHREDVLLKPFSNAQLCHRLQQMLKS
ncbi:MAG: PAS domain S-box protein [Candidatus Sericytochromatia bacterium]|nr:PAS domain S-box protein [Candidatus Sericytochromatia bacterium]